MRRVRRAEYGYAFTANCQRFRLFTIARRQAILRITPETRATGRDI